jgi:hypothetical protein
MAMIVRSGARLQYVVQKLNGKVKRHVHSWENNEIQRKVVDEPAGYMVFFPKGHAIRIRDLTRLKHFGLDKPPKIANLGEGMVDPNTPLGRVMMSQEEGDRALAWSELEKEVIAMATAKTGPNILTQAEV